MKKIEIAAGFYRNLTPPVYDPDNMIPSTEAGAVTPGSGVTFPLNV